MEKNFVAEGYINKLLEGDTLQLSKDAKLAKIQNNEVIDATLGTFLFDNGSFETFDEIKHESLKLSDKEAYAYGSIAGDESFHNGVMKYLFKEYADEINNNMFFHSIPTPGGTGALVASITTTLNEGETILIPIPCWKPYIGMAEIHNINIEYFSLLRDDKFNLSEFITKANKIIAKQQKLVFILNDPCNNPTGYSLKEEEIESLINYLNGLTVPCVVIYDCAYIDMASDDFDFLRTKLMMFKNLNDNIIVSFCVSFSKSYFIYGKRLGSLMLMGKDENVVNSLYNASIYFARHTWSNCNHEMTSVISKLFQHEEHIKSITTKQLYIQKILKQRSEVFLKECKKYDIKTHFYDDGFFISIPCNNVDSNTLCNKLKSRGVYLIPIFDTIRVSICSLSLKECERLPYIINSVMNNNK